MNNNTQAGFDELDQLLQESVNKPKAKAKPTTDFGDLDDLLSESLAIRDESLANKANREKLKRGGVGMSREAREEIEAKVREWESRNVWNTISNVAVFERVTCVCGIYTDAFSHVMHKQQHRSDPTVTRLIRTDEVILSLPRKVAIQNSDVEFCAECAEGKGWDMVNIQEDLEWDAAKL